MRACVRALSPPPSQQHVQMATELVSGGAIQKEVTRMVHVHEQLRDGAGEFELCYSIGVTIVPEGVRNEHDVDGHRHDEEHERHAQQHDRHSVTGVFAEGVPDVACW